MLQILHPYDKIVSRLPTSVLLMFRALKMSFQKVSHLFVFILVSL